MALRYYKPGKAVGRNLPHNFRHTFSAPVSRDDLPTPFEAISRTLDKKSYMDPLSGKRIQDNAFVPKWHVYHLIFPFLHVNQRFHTSRSSLPSPSTENSGELGFLFEQLGKT